MKKLITLLALTGLLSFVVPALYAEQSISEVPIAVSAFSSAQLERLNVKSVTEGLINLLPTKTASLTINKAYIRGVGQFEQNPLSVGDPGAPLYLAFGSDDGAGNWAIDIANVEVLRGPQGTLFGRNNYNTEHVQISIRRHDDAAPGGMAMQIDGVLLASASPQPLETWEDALNGGITFTPHTFYLYDRSTTDLNTEEPVQPASFDAEGITSSFYQAGHANNNWGLRASYSGAVRDLFEGLGNRSANARDALSAASYDSLTQYDGQSLTHAEIVDGILEFYENNDILGGSGFGLYYFGDGLGSSRSFTGENGTAQAWSLGPMASISDLASQFDMGRACLGVVTEPGGYRFPQLVGGGSTLGRDWILTASDTDRSSAKDGAFDRGLRRSWVSDINSDGNFNLDGKLSAEWKLTICAAFDLTERFRLVGPLVPAEGDDTFYAKDFWPIDVVEIRDVNNNFALDPDGPPPDRIDFYVQGSTVWIGNPSRLYMWPALEADLMPNGAFWGVNFRDFAGEADVATTVSGNITQSGFSGTISMERMDHSSSAFDFQSDFPAGTTHEWNKEVPETPRINGGIALNGYYGRYRWTFGDPLRVSAFVDNAEFYSQSQGGSDLNYTIGARVNLGLGFTTSYDLNTQHFSTEGLAPAYTGLPVNFPDTVLEDVPYYKNTGADASIFLEVAPPGDDPGFSKTSQVLGAILSDDFSAFHVMGN